MKKSLFVLASIMVLALCIFVACTAEVADPYDGLTYVTFGGETPASRNLLARYDVASYDGLYWFYTAEKKDNYGTSGAASNAPVRKDGESGLDGTVGPFSQGKWLFTLCAYKKNAVSDDDKVYEGSVEVSLKGQKVTVPVSVTPYGENGALKFSGAYFEWKDNGKDAPVIEIVAKGTKTGQTYTLGNKIANDNTNPEDAKIKLDITSAGDNKTYKITDCEYSTVKADYYNCTIIAYIDDPNTPIFSQTLGFRVYGSATTVIEGDITEQSGTDVNFDPAKQDMAVFKGATTASVKVTPSGTDTTTVDFGANNLDNTSTYYLNVAATSVASAVNKFTVSDSTKAPVAGIDLELVKVSSDGSNSKVRNFSGDAVIITTYIEKGLTGVTVEYNGTDGDEPVGVDYNSDTGKLTFKTNHFSEFYAVSDSIAVVSNGTTEKGYARLADAFENSVDGSSIKLLNNAKLDEVIEVSNKKITLDLAGKVIGIGDTVERDGGIIYVLGGGDLTINDAVGTGGIDVTSSRKMENGLPAVWACIAVYPELTEKDSDGFKHLSNGRSRLTINGGSFVAPYYAIAGNGQCVDENSTIVTITDGSFESETAIFHPQNGALTITGGSFKGEWSALEIRAGVVGILGGNFESTASVYKCTPNGNGNTTEGASVAVAQHNTKLPIDVTISDGTFRGYHALSVMNPQNNDYSAIEGIKVNVKGGTFTSTKKNEGGKDVNYSSEFIKIDVGSSFTIRALKDGDEGNVAKLSDGRFFSSLQDAINGAKEGETVTMLTDFSNTSDYSVEGGNLMIDKNITLNGNGTVISGNVCLSVGPNGATIENIKFENIHNEKTGDGDLFKNVDTYNPSDYVDLSFKKDSNGDSVLKKGSEGNLSAIYANGLTGSLSITGCTFTNCDWDAVQVYVPAKTAKDEANKPEINISSNTFSMTEGHEGMRYIHIKTSYNEGNGVAFSELNVKNNCFFKCKNLISSSMDILYLNNADNGVVDLKENYFEGPVCVRIFGGSRENGCKLEDGVMDTAFPPNAESGYEGSKLLNNNWAELVFSKGEGCEHCSDGFYYVYGIDEESHKESQVGMECLMTAYTGTEEKEPYFDTVCCSLVDYGVLDEETSSFVKKVFIDFYSDNDEEELGASWVFSSHFCELHMD